MKRDLLIAALEREAGSLGYEFFAGPETLLPTRVGRKPTVWLLPPKLIAERGRHECRAIYRLTLYFLTPADPSLHGNFESRFATLERDACELFHRLRSDANIVATRGLEATPCRRALTKNGEVALEVEMEVEMFYCRE